LDMNHGATRHFGVEPEAFLGSFELMVGGEDDPRNLVLILTCNQCNTN